jgi:hypothetical protein
MKTFDYHHRQLDKNRDNHSRSNNAKLQSFNHFHERHRHWQLNRDICNNHHLFNVEHDFHNDEQETSLFEIHHEDHDLLRKNNEIRSRFERSWESSQKSSHRNIHELSNDYSSHSVFQETIWSISVASINSKNWAMRSRNSHSLNSRSRWSFRQWDSRHSCQRNHWMKTIKLKSRLINFRYCQFENIHLSD